MAKLIGIDIGSSTIKVVGLEKEGEKYFLETIGETQSPRLNWLPKSGQENKVKEVKKGRAELVVALKNLLSDLKVKAKQVVACLPEDRIVSRLVNLPSLKESEIRDALRFEAETFVPYPLEEVSIDYEIVNEDSAGRLTVFVIAARNDLIDAYVQLFKAVKLELLALESPAVALRRVVNHAMDIKNGVMVLDIGEAYSDIIGLNKGDIYFTRSLSVGGESLTRSISLNLGLDMASAEEYKKAYGMQEMELEGKIKAAIEPVFNSLVEETRKAIGAFTESQGQDVEMLVLSGGGANLPGFAEELTKILGLEVQVIQPFLNVDVSRVSVPLDLNSEGCRFALAIGSALRGMKL